MLPRFTFGQVTLPDRITSPTLHGQIQLECGHFMLLGVAIIWVKSQCVTLPVVLPLWQHYASRSLKSRMALCQDKLCSAPILHASSSKMLINRKCIGWDCVWMPKQAQFAIKKRIFFWKNYASRNYLRQNYPSSSFSHNPSHHPING